MQLTTKPFVSTGVSIRTQPVRTSKQIPRANLLDKLLKSNNDDDVELPGFRYDSAMQRWVKDERVSKKSVKSDSTAGTVQPMSGPSYTIWPIMHTYLTAKKLKSINQDEALKLMNKGAVLIDVRLGKAYNVQHAKGAVSVPMFQLTAGSDTWDKIKKGVFTFLAMDATERVPDFPGDVARAVNGNKRKKIIVMCDVGGTLDTVVRVATSGKVNENDPDRAFGRETRSLKACYELIKAGFSDVVHLQGGLSSWRYEGYPLE